MRLLYVVFAEFQIDMSQVSQLADMGFPFEACKKGVYHTKNAGVEPAMNWVMAHMDDPGKKRSRMNRPPLGFIKVVSLEGWSVFSLKNEDARKGKWNLQRIG